MRNNFFCSTFLWVVNIWILFTKSVKIILSGEKNLTWIKSRFKSAFHNSRQTTWGQCRCYMNCYFKICKFELMTELGMPKSIMIPIVIRRLGKKVFRKNEATCFHWTQPEPPWSRSPASSTFISTGTFKKGWPFHIWKSLNANKRTSTNFTYIFTTTYLQGLPSRVVKRGYNNQWRFPPDGFR